MGNQVHRGWATATGGHSATDRPSARECGLHPLRRCSPVTVIQHTDRKWLLLYCVTRITAAPQSRVYFPTIILISKPGKNNEEESTMKKVSLIFILSMAIAAFANAQATRTWVSGVG